MGHRSPLTFTLPRQAPLRTALLQTSNTSRVTFQLRNYFGAGTFPALPAYVSPDRSGRGRISTMESAKEQVQQILEMLPEDASLEDIQYHIYVRQKIEQGLEDVEAGRVVTHAEVQRRLAKWLTK